MFSSSDVGRESTQTSVGWYGTMGDHYHLDGCVSCHNISRSNFGQPVEQPPLWQPDRQSSWRREW